NAYGSAAQVPVIGYILAPIAAAMAVAAGVMQIATIKKQQQASEAQGYESGGFTPQGKSDEVAGVVHKGEWVASQRLVNNPRTRPLLEALDYAQRTNTIGSITAADVSRTITAPAVIAAQPQAPTVVNNTTYNQAATDNSELTSTIRELKDRLNEPFVTVNTVSGDHGIQKAQDDYSRLMKNKSPKSRK
ncbi:MAG: phage tail tape measure protein, partial [Prevotella sp.]|nr:phage tail tape measure protein [Prevotella sp.]